MRPQQGTTRLVRAGFADAPAAETILVGLGLWADGAPSDEAAEQVLLTVVDVADPDLALAGLERLVAVAVPSPEALLAALRDRPGLRRRLLTVLGASEALADHLASHPDAWRLLEDDDLVAARPSLFGMQATLLSVIGVDPVVALPWGSGAQPGTRTGPAALRALRTAYRGMLLCLAARDLTGQVAVDDVGGELADLASSMLTAALAYAAGELPHDAPPCRLAVIAMGKTGGRELNYVSDVDVVFVAEPVTADQESDAALRTATKLAGGMMRVCAEVAWPVDAGLRPEGNAGPLVRSLASHRAYYERWASTWEFQALLKARPVAGDLGLGRDYCAAVAPRVWTASERPGFVADVQAMRRRVEETLTGDAVDRELKLGRGGLRDIEFAVQLLQLVHGRADDRVHSGTTVVALEQLAEAGYVGREDARSLADAYRWLRTVEHRLQLSHLRRTHLLPAADDRDAQRVLARSIGHLTSPLDSFGRERNGYRHLVRRLHEKLFYRPLLGAVAQLPMDELPAPDSRLGTPAAEARLAALGFVDPAAALRHLEALTEGLSRRAAIQRTLLPVLLGWFAGAADPDAGLLAYRRVSDALGSTPWFLRLLRDEGAVAERLAVLLASSRYAGDLLVRAPEGVRLLAGGDELVPRSRETLIGAFTAAAGRQRDSPGAVLAARALRRQELLRVAAADVLLDLDRATVGRALSDVAAATVQAALATATRTIGGAGGAVPVRLAVIAMGRLGGGEQSYGSDADVLFVHEPVEGAEESEAARVAVAIANELRRLLALPGPDPALVVDADLRPEGRQGALSRSLSAYARYYERWSHVWEAQALLRAAPLAGDVDLTTRFLALADTVRYPDGGLTDEQVIEVRRIKARVERERAPRGGDPALTLKLGRGGLADVEWTVQLLQLRHAHEVPALRTTSTLGALTAAREAGLVTDADADALREAWLLSARTRDALVLVAGKDVAAIPTSGRDLDAVARALGRAPGEQGEFLDQYRRATRRARTVVERVFYG